MEALFLEHEGYFGALGAFLLAQEIPLADLERRHQPRREDDGKPRRRRNTTVFA